MTKAFTFQILIYILLIASLSCQTSEIADPVITTTASGGSGLPRPMYELGGKMINSSQRSFTYYGFVYSLSSQLPVVEQDSVLKFNDFRGQEFFTELTGETLVGGKTYYARAFVQTGDGKTYYGNVASFKVLPGRWKKIASFPGVHRKSSLTFSVGDNAYILGGESLELDQYNDLWCYNAITDTWSQKAAFPGTGMGVIRDHFSLVTFGNSAYLFGYGKIWSYNTNADAWTNVSEDTSIEKFPMAFSIGDKIFVATVNSFFAPNMGFNEYNIINGSYTGKKQYPGMTSDYYYSVTASGKQYVMPAVYSMWGNGHLNEFYQYDPVTNMWKERTSYTTSTNFDRSSACMFTVADKIYFGLGKNENNADYGDFHEYDPSSDSWRDINAIAGSDRSDALCFSIDRKGYVGLGFYHYYEGEIDKLYDFWEFTPE